SQGWGLLTLLVLCGTGAVLALTRGISARGFSLGIALAVLPGSLVYLWSAVDSGSLFAGVAEAAPLSDALGRLQLLIMPTGAVTLTVLTLRPGIPAQPGPPPVP